LPRVGRVLAFLLLLALAAGRTAAEQLPVRAYDIQDGLAGDSITHILRDSRGFLWLSTTDGLSRFDGERFTSYSGEDGLPHARVYQVLEARDGSHWLATQGGLTRFAGDRRAGRRAFTVVPLGGAAPRGPVYALYEDGAGRLWVGGENRLVVLERRPWAILVRDVPLGGLPLPAGAVTALAGTADGSVWVGCQGGLLRVLPDGRAVPWPVLPHHGADAVQDLAVDREGRLWIAHRLGAFVLMPGPEGTMLHPSLSELTERAGGVLEPGVPARLPRAPGEVVALDAGGAAGWRSIAFGRDGRVWLATTRGLVVWDKGKLTAWTMDDGLPERSLTAVAEDRAGNVWVGTESGGALRLARRGLVGFTVRDGLADPRITSLLVGRDGALYAQSGDTFDATLFLQRFDGSRFTAVRPRLPAGLIYLGWSRRQSAVYDRAGEWWLATGQGVLRYPAVPFAALATTEPVLYTERDGLGGGSILGLFGDRRGDLWIGSYGDRPLTRWHRATAAFRSWGLADGLPAGQPSAFAEDRRGDVWIGFSGGGLVRARGDALDTFGPAQGVPAGPVRDLFVDHAGRLWVSTENSGVGRLDDPDDTALPRFVVYTQHDGLASSEIRCITEDAWGRIYLGGRKGIDRLDPATGRIERFTTADGLQDNVVDTALRDSAGALWFGTRRGLSRLVPAPEPPSMPPAAWITAVRANGVPRVVSELGAPAVTGPVLDTDSRLEVEFLALSFAPGEALRYQHKLEGVDTDWSPPAAPRSVQYAHLPSKRLRFLVRAVTRDGATGAPAALSFTVDPPLWRRWWVLSLAGLAVVSAAAGLYRARVAHLLALERMRTRIATDLHDDLGSSLSRISILSEVARRRVAEDGESARLVTDIGATAREMMEALGESIWAIDPRRDDLRSFITRVRRFAADLLDGRGIAWQLRAPQESELVKLSPVQRRQLFLFVKEALHNAARHSEAASVAIHLAVAGRRLTLEIRDDGRGFEPDTARPEGNGLRSLRQRAEALGARLEMDTAPGQGTRLFLEARLPARGGT
jgi:ligand-binding sensor domain-containing protein/signal transduction histidine kinase